MKGDRNARLFVFHAGQHYIHAMKISIRVKTNARKNEVTKLEDGKFLVSVAVPPIEGKANEKVVELLAKYLGKPKRVISIIRGLSSRDKVVEIG